MDRQQILLAKALEAAEIPLSVTTFDERLILQKASYILQSAGVHMGYRFRWYLKGPYSPDMSAGVFGILREGQAAEEELNRWKLDSPTKDRVDKVKPLLLAVTDKHARARHLECLASVLFLVKSGQCT